MKEIIIRVLLVAIVLGGAVLVTNCERNIDGTKMVFAEIEIAKALQKQTILLEEQNKLLERIAVALEEIEYRVK